MVVGLPLPSKRRDFQWREHNLNSNLCSFHPWRPTPENPLQNIGQTASLTYPFPRLASENSRFPWQFHINLPVINLETTDTAWLLLNPSSTNPVTFGYQYLCIYIYITCIQVPAPCSFPPLGKISGLSGWMVSILEIGPRLFIIVHLHFQGYHWLVVPGHNYHKAKHFYARVPLWLGVASTAYNL